MSSLRAILTVLISTAVFSLGMALGGFFIAKYSPDYYFTVFNSKTFKEFDPVQVGVGLGLTQGSAIGVVVGILAVLLEAWHRRKLIDAKSPAPEKKTDSN